MNLPPALIESSLLLRSGAIAYTAGARLRELRPGKAILECGGCGFDLDGFVEAGHASMSLLPDFGHNQMITGWRNSPQEGGGCAVETGSCLSREERLSQKIVNAFVRVEWQGNTLEVLRLGWTEMMASQQTWFLIAESKGTAEAFYNAVCEWSALPHAEVLVFEQGTWRKDRALFAAIRATSFANLVLAPGLKESLRDDITQFFSRREVYARYGVPWKRGVLLIGPPGNGKTHAVKALCHAVHVPALYVRSLEPQGMFHGSEHANISSAFDLARKTAPCLLLLEDLDALLKPGSRSLFLNELDGFADNTGICVVATTNFPERLDAAILDRPSRFDRKYHFDLPGPGERIAYLKLWNSQQTAELRLTEAGIESVAEATNGFSFAYMKELSLSIVMAWMNAGAKLAMDTIACAQADALMAQMRSQPAETPEPSDHLTPRQRFQTLMRGES